MPTAESRLDTSAYKIPRLTAPSIMEALRQSMMIKSIISEHYGNVYRAI